MRPTGGNRRPGVSGASCEIPGRRSSTGARMAFHGSGHDDLGSAPARLRVRGRVARRAGLGVLGRGRCDEPVIGHAKLPGPARRPGTRRERPGDTRRHRGEDRRLGAVRAGGQGSRAQDRLQPGAVRQALGRHRPRRVRPAQSGAGPGPQRGDVQARHARLRRAHRNPARPLHRPHDRVHPRRLLQRRRPDRPRGGPLGRLAEGRRTAGRADPGADRQRPAEPGRRGRPHQRPQGRRRRRDLAAAQHPLPLRLRGPPGGGEGPLPALGHRSRAGPGRCTWPTRRAPHLRHSRACQPTAC